MKNFFQTFLKDESGASAAEYALILAVVGVAIGGAALLLADTVGNAISDSASRVEACRSAAETGALDTAGCEADTLTTP
ncbi:MAG: Flp family type IVb pilin [Croceibacterium sp.]